METIIFQENDGGRAVAGRKGYTGDCVCRAICIATGRPYEEVYQYLASQNALERKTKGRTSGKHTASLGIHTTRKWFKDYMVSLGFTWVPTMKIGQGCTVHLRRDELPMGRLVVAVSSHFTAMIDGVITDTHNPDRGGNRCVYGYYILG